MSKGIAFSTMAISALAGVTLLSAAEPAAAGKYEFCREPRRHAAVRLQHDGTMRRHDFPVAAAAAFEVLCCPRRAPPTLARRTATAVHLVNERISRQRTASRLCARTFACEPSIVGLYGKPRTRDHKRSPITGWTQRSLASLASADRSRDVTTANSFCSSLTSMKVVGVCQRNFRDYGRLQACDWSRLTLQNYTV